MTSTTTPRWLADLPQLQSAMDLDGLARQFQTLVVARDFTGFYHVVSDENRGARLLVATPKVAERLHGSSLVKGNAVYERARRERACFGWWVGAEDEQDPGWQYLVRVGFHHGYAVPYRLQGSLTALTVYGSDSPQPVAARQAGLTALALALHGLAERLSAAGQRTGELTNRERECLQWAAVGKTSWETAQILAISERTVQYHLDNSRTKLSAANLTQAVALGVAAGLITA